MSEDMSYLNCLIEPNKSVIVLFLVHTEHAQIKGHPFIFWVQMKQSNQTNKNIMKSY